MGTVQSRLVGWWEAGQEKFLPPELHTLGQPRAATVQWCDQAQGRAGEQRVGRCPEQHVAASCHKPLRGGLRTGSPQD